MGCRELDIRSQFRFIEPPKKSHSCELTRTEKTAYSRFFHTVISNYRYFSAELGRWLKRDDIGERGGYNLFAMVTNNPINKWDYLGLKDNAPTSLEWEVHTIRDVSIPKTLQECGEYDKWEKDVRIERHIEYWRLAPSNQSTIIDNIDKFVESLGEDTACGMIVDKQKEELYGKAKMFFNLTSLAYSLFEWRKDDTIWKEYTVKCNCGKESVTETDSGIIKGNPYLSGRMEPILSGQAAEDFLADQVYNAVNDAIGGGLGKCIK